MGTFFADTFRARHQMCVDASDGTPVCVTGDELKSLLGAAAAGSLIGEPVGPAAPSASLGETTDTTTSTTPATLSVNGSNPAYWNLNAPWQDNFGATIAARKRTQTSAFIPSRQRTGQRGPSKPTSCAL
jgi:hypothetical protein